MTIAEIEFKGEVVGGTIVYGDDRCLASLPWSPADSRSIPATRS